MLTERNKADLTHLLGTLPDGSAMLYKFARPGSRRPDDDEKLARGVFRDFTLEGPALLVVKKIYAEQDAGGRKQLLSMLLEWPATKPVDTRAAPIILEFLLSRPELPGRAWGAWIEDLVNRHRSLQWLLCAIKWLATKIQYEHETMTEAFFHRVKMIGEFGSSHGLIATGQNRDAKIKEIGGQLLASSNRLLKLANTALSARIIERESGRASPPRLAPSGMLELTEDQLTVLGLVFSRLDGDLVGPAAEKFYVENKNLMGEIDILLKLGLLVRDRDQLSLSGAGFLYLDGVVGYEALKSNADVTLKAAQRLYEKAPDEKISFASLAKETRESAGEVRKSVRFLMLLGTRCGTVGNDGPDACYMQPNHELLRLKDVSQMIEIVREQHHETLGYWFRKHLGEDLAKEQPESDGREEMPDATTRESRSAQGKSLVAVLAEAVGSFAASTQAGAPSLASADVNLYPESLRGYRLKKVPIEIIDLIGEGGSAYVYKGRVVGEVEGLPGPGTMVAVKITQDFLLEKNEIDVTMGRIAREASLRGIVNANLVASYGHYSEKLLGRERPYIIQELIDGVTLKELILMSGRATPRQFVRMLTDVAKGLRFLHEKEITHRDLKPSNIMIAKTGPPRVVIMDLGISHMPDGLDLTKSYECKGTWRRAPPEFLFRDPPEASENPEVDLYELGTVAYDLIMGKEFLGHVKNDAQIAEAVKNWIPDVENPDYPLEIIRLTQRLLDKKPEGRPKLKEVEAALSGARPSGEKAKAQTRTGALAGLPAKSPMVVIGLVERSEERAVAKLVAKCVRGDPALGVSVTLHRSKVFSSPGIGAGQLETFEIEASDDVRYKNSQFLIEYKDAEGNEYEVIIKPESDRVYWQPSDKVEVHMNGERVL